MRKDYKGLLISKIEHHFSPFISANRKFPCTEHVLIRLLEDWRNKLGNNTVLGTVLTDLSKAFGCIPHDLLVAKLDEYGFNRDTESLHLLIFEKQEAMYQNKWYTKLPSDIISGVPQGSILGPILFNLLFNDLFYFILLATAQNFADDNTFACFSKTIQELIGFLESKCEVALDWFNENKMIANPGKF